MCAVLDMVVAARSHVEQARLIFELKEAKQLLSRTYDAIKLEKQWRNYQVCRLRKGKRIIGRPGESSTT